MFKKKSVIMDTLLEPMRISRRTAKEECLRREAELSTEAPMRRIGIAKRPYESTHIATLFVSKQASRNATRNLRAGPVRLHCMTRCLVSVQVLPITSFWGVLYGEFSSNTCRALLIDALTLRPLKDSHMRQVIAVARGKEATPNRRRAEQSCYGTKHKQRPPLRINPYQARPLLRTLYHCGCWVW